MSVHNIQKKRNESNAILGILIAAIGILFLLDKFNILEFNLKVAPVFLIIIGIVNGYKNGFGKLGSLIFIIGGVLWLLPSFTIAGVRSGDLFWPTMLIVSGIYIALRSTSKHTNSKKTSETSTNFTEVSSLEYETLNDNSVKIDAFFGGRKEIITSKQFKGCSATAVFGGAEINLMQADNISQPMVIDLKVFFGGIEIIVPSHWELINEVDVIFGGIEDKRNLRTNTEAGNVKKLLLRGSVAFGGLELKSY